MYNRWKMMKGTNYYFPFDKSDGLMILISQMKLFVVFRALG